MRTIWKFPLDITDRQKVEMPKFATLLSVQLQNGVACLWVEVDSEQPKERRTFAIYGTGNPIPNNPGEYVGTFQQGPFVWHLYEFNEYA